MKKFLSLELAIAFFMCTIAFYFGGIYFNFNFNNHFQSAVNIVSTQSQKIPNADLTYADLTSTDAKQIDVLFFCYNEDKTNPEKNPSLGSSNELLTNIQTSLASFSQYIKTASYNNAKVEFNFVSTATNTSPDDDGTPLILSIDKPATINKASLFSAVMNELEDFTGSGTKEDYLNIALTQSLHNSGNDMILIYLDYKSYLEMPKEDAQTRYNENTSGVFSLDYSINTQDSTKFFIKSHYSGALCNNDIYGTSTDIDNYFLIHSDALTSFLITQNAEPDFFNLVSSKFTKMMLSMYGLPNLAFNNGQGNDYDTTYAGNHSILSNGTYFATFNPYYAYLLGQEIDNARGWLPATFTITEIKKETEITFERDGQDIYYIAPEDYPDQRIVIYYANTSEYNQWTFKEGQSTPPTDGYVIVARVQTQKNQDGSLASASNTYTPFYVFEPSSINGELTQRSSTLENARLANVGDVIGFTELGVNGTATTPYTGYVSFEKNVGGITNYINSTLKFSLTEKDANGIKVKVECNNSDFLLPENVAVKQALNDVVNLSTDVKIYLYNHYIEKNGQAILNNEEEFKRWLEC